MTAPSPARPARRGPRVLAAVVLVALLAVGPAWGAAAATSPPPTPTPSTGTGTGTGTGTVAFTLSPVAGGVAAPEAGFAAVVAVQNDTTAALPAASVQLLFGSTPLATRSEAAAWAEAPDTRALQQVGAITLDPVSAGERRTWSFVVSPNDPTFAGLVPGVYPLLAVYGEGEEARSSSSTIVVSAPAAGSAPVAVLVPITAPPQTAGLLTSDQLAQYTAADGTLTQQLDGVDGTRAILAIDPAVVASIRVLGTAAPETAAAWLARLLALPNSRFALQFGDADVSAQMHSDLGMLLQPESFDAQLNPADFAADSLGAQAPPTAGALDDPVLPTLDELLDVGETDGPAVYWPATGTADAEVVDRLAAADASCLVLVPSDTTSSSPATVPARAEHTLVYDSVLSAALDDASVLDDAVERGGALARVSAQLAFALPDAAGAPLLVTLDRADGRSRVAIRAAIAAVSGSDGVVLDDLGDIVAAASRDVVVTGGTPVAARVAAVDDLVADEAAVADFATILDDPRLLTAPQRAATLQTLGGGWTADEAAWQSALAQRRVDSAGTLASVSIPPPTDVNLLTANTRLQFVVRNALPWPVSVTLVAEPDDPRLRVQRFTQVPAQPAADTRVVVPVESRVGSGDVSVALQLRGPGGVAIGGSDSVGVRVRAEWEGIGVIALSVLVGGLLALGIVRTILRRRGRVAAADEAAVTESQGGGEG